MPFTAIDKQRATILLSIKVVGAELATIAINNPLSDVCFIHLIGEYQQGESGIITTCC